MELKGIMSRNPKLRHRFSIVVVVLAAFAAVVQAQRAFYERVTINSVCQMIAGSGTPESAVTANVCDLFQRSDGGSGTSLYVKESGTGNTGWSPATTAAGTITFTNKTLDAEGTGNLLTIPERKWLEAATCDNATPATDWSLPTGTARPAPACITGTNTQRGALDFDDTNDENAQTTIRLPTDFTGAIDAVVFWQSTATTGNAVWQVQTICVADAETGDPAYNTASTVTDATKGVANQFNSASLTGITITGCTANEVLFFRIRRNPADAGDTLGATARLIGVEVTVRRAI